jgi:GNAT superfamily N-acetyltransferase
MTSKLEEVIVLGEMMFEESPFSTIKSGDEIPNILAASAANGSLFIEEIDGKVVGFLAALTLSYHPIVGECNLAAEVAWYVHPDFRDRGLAATLLTKYEQWAELSGASHCVTSAMFNDTFDKVKSMYEKRGYVMHEASFMKEFK